MTGEVKNSVTVLLYIQQQISDTFPGAAIEPVFDTTGAVNFHIHHKANRYTVIVAEKLLDCDGGVDAALKLLAPLGIKLKCFEPGRVLVLGEQGLFSPPGLGSSSPEST